MTCILRWRANARRQRFQRRRQQVSQQLLLLKPGFQRVLSESRSRLAQLQAVGALQQMDAGAFRLEALVSQQQEYQSAKVAPLLARCVAATVADVEALALRLQSSERLLQREVSDYAKDRSAGASQGLCPVKVGRTPAARGCCGWRVCRAAHQVDAAFKACLLHRVCAVSARRFVQSVQP